jgi:signal peptidase II
MHEIRPVFGDFFRLTYTHNPGAAFGINIGEHSRLFFLALSIAALGVLGWMYRSTPRGDMLRLAALALVCGGAIGNIIDRFRYEAGVVDFIDVGFGTHRFWIFNVADSAVSVGAVLLLISFYLEEKREKREDVAAV